MYNSSQAYLTFEIPRIGSRFSPQADIEPSTPLEAY